DQVISFCGTTITSKQVGDALNIVDQELFFKVSDVIKAKDAKAALDLVDEVIRSGYDVKEFASGIAEHFRNFLIAKTTGSTQLIEEAEMHRKRYAADAEALSLHDILRIIKVVTETENSMRYSAQPRFKLEVMIVQLTKMEQSVKIDELLLQIDELKKKLHANGSVVATPPLESVKPVKNFSSVPSTIEEAKPRYTFTPSPVIAVSEPNKKVEQPIVIASAAVDVSLTAVQDSWNIIVDAMRKKKINVGTILAETQPLDIINGTLRIGCGDEFHKSTLFRNKEILGETINSILSSKLRIDPIIHADPVPLKHEAPPKTNGNSQPALPSEPSAEDHPLIKALHRDFDAEKVN
ncbi:MAG: hypothetical protein PHP42_14165, partial [Bacteroidota bacterium]|nr:hypothetical protein [Bacteroidota bacterium]